MSGVIVYVLMQHDRMWSRLVGIYASRDAAQAAIDKARDDLNETRDALGIGRIVGDLNYAIEEHVVK